MSTTAIGQADQGKGRRMLLLLVVVFALPVALVLAMYQLDWRPGGDSYGELIKPPRPLQLTELHDAQGEPFPAARWKEKWHLVYLVGNGCPAACQQQVKLLRQIHVSLNKEIGRVERVLLAPASTGDITLAGLHLQYPDLVILTGADAASVAGQFVAGSSPQESDGQVYLVDPLGNVMMRYPSDYDPKGLRRDLGRLLRYSWVG